MNIEQSPAPMIVLEPQDEVVFRDRLGHVSSVPLTIRNKNESKIFFKIKSNASKFYIVRPSTGIIMPHGQVKIILQPHDDNITSLDEINRNRHRFMIQSAFVGNNDNISVENFWKTIDNSNVPVSTAKIHAKAEIKASVQEEKLDGSKEVPASTTQKKTAADHGHNELSGSGLELKTIKMEKEEKKKEANKTIVKGKEGKKTKEDSSAKSFVFVNVEKKGNVEEKNQTSVKEKEGEAKKGNDIVMGLGINSMSFISPSKTIEITNGVAKLVVNGEEGKAQMAEMDTADIPEKQLGEKMNLQDAEAQIAKMITVEQLDTLKKQQEEKESPGNVSSFGSSLPYYSGNRPFFTFPPANQSIALQQQPFSPLGYNAMSFLQCIVCANDGTNEIFGRYVAKILNKLPTKKAAQMKKEINDLVAKYEEFDEANVI